MSRLSSPESVITKLASIHQKVDQLCETVEQAGRIRDNIVTAHEQVARYEAGIRDKVDVVSGLEAQIVENIRQLKEVQTSSETALAKIKTDAADENSRVNATLKHFDDQRARLDRLRAVTEHKIALSVRDMGEQMAWLKEDIHNSLGQVHQEAMRRQDENEHLLRERADQTAVTMETALEEIGFLEVRLAAFRQFLWKHQNDRIDAVAEQQRIFQESALYDIHTRIAEGEQRFSEQAASEIRELQAAYARKENEVEKAIDLMATERAAVVAHHQTMAQDLSHIKKDVGALLTDGRKQISRSVEESNTVIGREVAHVTSFIAESEDEIQSLKNDLQSFRNRLAESIKGETEKLFHQQTEFERKLKQELREAFSKDSSRLRQQLEKEMQKLASGKKEIAEMHQILDDTVSGVNRKIGGKATFFTTQLNNLIVNAQKEVTQATADVQNKIEKRLAELTTERENNRAMMKSAREGLEKFSNQVRDRMVSEFKKVSETQATFKNGIGQLISGAVTEAAAKTQQEMENRQKRRFEELLRQQKASSALLQKEAAALEKRIAAIDTENQKFATARKAELAKHTANFKRLGDAQTKQIKPLEARVAAIEAALTELGQKKGLLSIFQQKGQ